MSILSLGTPPACQGSDFDSFLKEVDYAQVGNNEGVDLPFSKMGEYVNLRSSMLYVVGGYTGSGKTSFVDEVFVLSTMDTLREQNRLGKLKITYWSFERKKKFKIARWVSRHIFKLHGVIIPIKRILGWGMEKLSSDEYDLVLSAKEYFDELFEHITIIDGRQNPTGIRKYVEQMALRDGRIEGDKFSKIYYPNDPSVINLHIFDHVGKVKKESNKSAKETIDDFSDDVSDLIRDFYGHSAVVLTQLNRDISNPLRIKNGDVEPRLEDVKNTGDLCEDADCVMTLFDPWRYKIADPGGYDLKKFRDDKGAKKYRSINLLKNSFDGEGLRFGAAYQPQTGMFGELPRSKEMTDAIYQSVVNDSFFRKVA